MDPSPVSSFLQCKESAENKESETRWLIIAAFIALFVLILILFIIGKRQYKLLKDFERAIVDVEGMRRSLVSALPDIADLKTVTSCLIGQQRVSTKRLEDLYSTMDELQFAVSGQLHNMRSWRDTTNGEMSTLSRQIEAVTLLAKICHSRLQSVQVLSSYKEVYSKKEYYGAKFTRSKRPAYKIRGRINTYGRQSAKRGRRSMTRCEGLLS